MALGAYVLDNKAGNSSYYGGAYTLTEAVQFSQPVWLRSVLVTAALNGTFTGRAVIYSAASGIPLVAQGPTQSLSFTGGTQYEIPFTSPLLINAGITYRIGVYQPTGGYVYLTGSAAQKTNGFITSTPPWYVNMTKQSNGLWFNTYTGSPTTNDTSYSLVGGVSVDPVKPVGTPTYPTTGATVNNNGPVTFTWTNLGEAQEGYEIMYRKVGVQNTSRVQWTRKIVYTTTPSHTFPKDTFESGARYEWIVLVRGASYTQPMGIAQQFDVNSWTTESIVNSSSTTGVVNATAFSEGNYEFQVRVADNNAAGVFSPWSTIKAETLGPPNQGPTLNVTNLNPQAVDSDATLTWTYSDPEGNGQAKYQIRYRKKI